MKTLSVTLWLLLSGTLYSATLTFDVDLTDVEPELAHQRLIGTITVDPDVAATNAIVGSSLSIMTDVASYSLPSAPIITGVPVWDWLVTNNDLYLTFLAEMPFGTSAKATWLHASGQLTITSEHTSVNQGTTAAVWMTSPEGMDWIRFPYPSLQPPLLFGTDGRDARFQLWMENFGVTDSLRNPMPEHGDADEDGDVDGADFVICQRGTRVFASSIPEPASIALAWMLVAVLAAVWRAM